MGAMAGRVRPGVTRRSAVPNMLFRSKDPPSGPLSDPWFRWLFSAAPHLFWGGLALLVVGPLVGLVTD